MAMIDGKVRWQWQGSKVGLKLKCSNGDGVLEAHLRTPAYPEEEKYAWVLDGVRVAAFDSAAGTLFASKIKHKLELPAGSSLVGEHTLELVKISEAVVVPMMWSLADGRDATVFEGFQIPASCQVLDPPARPERRLEFVGDSITCGFGNLVNNLGDTLKCAVPPSGFRDYEDFSFAVPTLASAAFGAEVHTECISGVGITRNGGTFTKTTTSNMSHYIHGALLTDHDIHWDYMSWVPHVAIINLGTNDYDLSQYVGIEPSFDDFRTHYAEFLTDFIRHYMGRLEAVIIACGPMTTQQCPTVANTAKDIAAAFPSIKVRYVDLRVPKSQVAGCIGHPNVAGDQAMFDMFKPVVTELTGWTPHQESIIV